MLSTYFKPDKTPKEIAAECAFTADGRLVWGSLKPEGFRFDRLVRMRNDVEITRHIADPDLAVILAVAGGTHWVVATGTTWPRRNFKIADPWLGDRATMTRYKNDITAAAYFRRV